MSPNIEIPRTTLTGASEWFPLQDRLAILRSCFAAKGTTEIPASRQHEKRESLLANRRSHWAGMLAVWTTMTTSVPHKRSSILGGLGVAELAGQQEKLPYFRNKLAYGWPLA